MTKSNTKTKVTQKRAVRSRGKNITYLIIGGLTLIILAGIAIWGITSLTTKPESETSTVSTQKIEKTVSGKTADEDRKDALAAATNILNIAANSPEDENFEQRLNKLDQGDRSAIDPALEDTVRFTDVFAESADMQINTYQGLVTLSALIQQTTNNNEIAPSTDTMFKNVYMDSETGTAFVPLAIYSGPAAGFSFEMVYVDGEWKLAPYSLLDAIKLSAKLQLNNAETPSSQ